MKWKAVSATRTSAAAPPKAWPITTTSIASRPNGCWKPPSCSTRSGWRRTPLAHPQLEALLKWAAMLHEVGLSINHSGMHRHSAYILQNSNLPGFNQEQQLLLAALVRFHRKAIKLEELPRLNLFKKKHYLPLIQLLRLSTLLNNQRQSTTTPETLRLTTDDNHWTLRFPAGYLAQNNLVQLDFEREQAYWNDVVGWKLLIDEEGSQDEQRSA